MADYVIGDVQGCYDPLMRLLDQIDFNERIDRLWFVGDLVNRGPHSLAVLRFVQALPIAPRVALGNHDLHLLSHLFGSNPYFNGDDSFQEILMAPDREDLGHWLRCQSILYHDVSLNVVLCHAGIAPRWTLDEAKARALELETALSGSNYVNYLTYMYGNEPDYWSEGWQGIPRLRVITNYFTRMRVCDAKGRLILSYKGNPTKIPSTYYPWFNVPSRCPIEADIVFGHWAALEGVCDVPGVYALDTGCFWGGSLTALRLQDKQRFFVPGV